MIIINRFLFLILLSLAGNLAQAVDYDIVYVRQVRFGDDVNTLWPEVFHPARMDPGADLVLLHPDGSEEILVDCDVCGVTDPFVSFDAQWVYYSLFYDLSPGSLNTQRGDLPHQGADIFRIHLNTREIQQLTFGEFTPNTGAGNWDESNPLNPDSQYNRLGYGILNLGPMPLPGGKIAFTSNRNGFVPPKGFTNPTLQIFVMDIDGKNVEEISPMTIGSALHPTILQDGRLMFSSYESQGLRDRRLWGIWSIDPDGRNWQPVVSALTSPNAYHFMTQLSSGEIVVEQYYNLNNNGFGALFGLPSVVPQGTPAFGSPYPQLNPAIDQTSSDSGVPSTFQFSFTPFGFYALTPMTHPADHAAPLGPNGVDRVGKFTHPSAAPDNDLLVAWTPGPANDLNRPTTIPYYDSGIYVMNNTQPVWFSNELELVKNDPNYNEAWPRAVVPWSQIHGTSEPQEKEWLPNDGSAHNELEEGTPFGLVGTSSFYKRDTTPGKGDADFDGLDALNTSQNNASSNWFWQGADSGKYTNSDIWAVRLLAMEPNTDRRYGPNSAHHGTATDFYNHANERLRIMGEIPLRKTTNSGDTVMDPEGNPDSSFLAKIPADTPFTFQTLDSKGMVLNMSQTWHQVRPGEQRSDCGGCHAHSQMPLAFEQTAASQEGYEVRNLLNQTPLINLDGSLTEEDVSVLNVEFFQDIRPVLQAKCISCHNGTDMAGELNLASTDYTSNTPNGIQLPGDYLRLAADPEANYGLPPVINNGTWRQTNASRYIRKFQSRRSLLIWKIFGERLDGWSNADHPTESVAGDANTLPNGANANDADLDFIATASHPAGGMTQLTDAEKQAFVRWIDLGAPVDLSADRGNPGMGWFLDDLKPTVTVSRPRPNFNENPVNQIRVGVVDAYTGIDESSLSIKADFEVNGLSAGSELVSLATEVSQGVYLITLDQPVSIDPIERHIFVEVEDHQGNVRRKDVRFFTVNPDIIFAHDFDL